MHFLPENRMCAPPFATKQRPPIWKILDPPLCSIELFSWLFYKLWADSWKTPTMVIFTINIPTDWSTPVGIPQYYTEVTITLRNEK